MSMKLTQSNFGVVHGASKVTSSLSLVSSIIFFYIYFYKPLPARCPTSSIVFAIGVTDFIDSVFKFAGRWIAENGPTSFSCQLQAVFIQASELIGICLILSLAFLGLLIVRFNITVEQIEKAEMKILASCIALPLAMTLVPYAVAGTSFYGDNLLWCWIADRYDTSRIFLMYLPAWTTGFFSIFVSSILIIEMQTDSRFLLLQRKVNTVSRNNTLITAVERIFAYLLAYIVFCLPCSIYQMNLVMTGTENFGLAVWFALTSPAKSCINLIAYIIPWWRQTRAIRGSIRLVNAPTIFMISSDHVSSSRSSIVSLDTSQSSRCGSPTLVTQIPSQTPTLLRGFSIPKFQRSTMPPSDRPVSSVSEKSKTPSKTSSGSSNSLQGWVPHVSPRLSNFSFEKRDTASIWGSKPWLSNADTSNGNDSNADAGQSTSTHKSDVKRDQAITPKRRSMNLRAHKIRFSDPIVTNIFRTYLSDSSPGTASDSSIQQNLPQASESPLSTFSSPGSRASMLPHEQSRSSFRWISSFPQIPSFGIASGLKNALRRISRRNSQTFVPASTVVLNMNDDN